MIEIEGEEVEEAEEDSVADQMSTVPREEEEEEEGTGPDHPLEGAGEMVDRGGEMEVGPLPMALALAGGGMGETVGETVWTRDLIGRWVEIGAGLGGDHRHLFVEGERRLRRQPPCISSC